MKNAKILSSNNMLEIKLLVIVIIGHWGKLFSLFFFYIFHSLFDKQYSVLVIIDLHVAYCAISHACLPVIIRSSPLTMHGSRDVKGGRILVRVVEFTGYDTPI